MTITLVPAVLVKNEADAPVHLQRINFDNIQRTKYDALVKEIRHVFSATTLRDLVKKSYEAKMQMQRDGLFEDILVMVDVCRSGETEVKKLSQAVQTTDSPPTSVIDSIPLELSFVVKEPKRIRANFNAGVNNRGEGQTGAGVTAKSLFGRGEVLSGETNYGNKRTTLWHLSFVKPLLGWRDTSLSLHGYRNYLEAPASAYSSVENGIAGMLSHQTFRNFTHNLRLSAEWRKLSVLHNAAAWAIREQAGHSLKMSVHNTVKYSTVDSEVLPTKGMLFKISQEIAGLGGDVEFLKHSLELKGSAPLPFGFFFTPSVHADYVIPRGGQSLSMIDRVYLGGPTDLRGFGFHGVGPAQDGAFMGGMASWSAGLHLYRPLIPRRFLFAHAFGVAGNLCPVSYTMTNSDVMDALTDDVPRCSVGVGLAVKLMNVARLELNYVCPITTSSQDVLAPGLQFGVGISFL